MKIKVEIVEDISEMCCTIKTASLNDEVNKIVNYIKKLDDLATEYIIGVDLEKEKTIILKPEEIYMICVEEKKTYIYTKKEKYISKKRLCELESVFGNSFFRISKSTLVSVDAMDNIEASFGGIFVMTLKNGCKQYISRKYLPELKKYLGI